MHTTASAEPVPHLSVRGYIARAATVPEGWPSGLRRTLGKRVYGKPYRGFESHSLRQLSCFVCRGLEEKVSVHSVSPNTHDHLHNLAVRFSLAIRHGAAIDVHGGLNRGVPHQFLLN